VVAALGFDTDIEVALQREGAVLHSLVLRGKRCRKDLIARVSGGDCRSLKGV
jgi:hypothetical protein